MGKSHQELLQESILSGLGVDPAAVDVQYNALLIVKRHTGSERSWWDILSDLDGFTIEKLVTGALWDGQRLRLVSFSGPTCFKR